ncbi:unnamed protein product, partial [Choristocarpus tenellus]
RLSNPPLNPLSHGVRAGMIEGLSRAENDPAVTSIVITGNGNAFSAGADIKEMSDVHSILRHPSLTAVVAAIENCSIPVSAAINGVALGGGCEVALACHFRVASPQASLGVPEVLIGLLPGAGGTQRLPRLVGAKMALSMTTNGKMVSAHKALEAGLVDHMIASVGADLVEAAALFAQQRLSEKGGNLDAFRCRNMPLKDPPLVVLKLCDNMGMEVGPPVRGKEPVWACVEALRAAALQGGPGGCFDLGIAQEGKLFSLLIQSQQSRARRHLFLAERSAYRVPMVVGTGGVPVVETVGVIGAGTMGGGIAIAHLLAGYRVTLIDAKEVGG